MCSLCLEGRKRHNTLEHGGRMSRSQRSAAFQIPTSFLYRRSNEQDNRRSNEQDNRRSNEQDNRRGRARSFRRDNAECELSMTIQASLETANADGRLHDMSSNRRVVSDQTRANDDDLLIPPFESLTTDSEPASRYLQTVSRISRNSQLEESSFPLLAVPPANSQPRPQSDALPKNTMASHLRRKQNKSTKLPSSSPAWPATTAHPPPVIGHQPAWPVITTASGSSSSSRHSKAATNKPSARVITPQQAWPAVNRALESASGSSQIKQSTAADVPPSSSYLNSVAARSSLVHESSSSSVGSSRSWAHSNKISHSSSAPNLVQSGTCDSSAPDFPPVSALQTRKLPASGQQAATNVEDVQTANNSLVERMHIALEFDQDKFTAFKGISAEYRQGLIDAETYWHMPSSLACHISFLSWLDDSLMLSGRKH